MAFWETFGSLTAKDAKRAAKGRRGKPLRPLRPSLRSLRLKISLAHSLFLPFALMPFDNSDRRGEEVEGFAQTILQVTLVRKMQAAFAARREDDEARRAHADLRDVLHAQARAPAFDRRGGRGRAGRINRAREEVVELRGRNTQVARMMRVDGERQDARHALPRQRRDEDDRRVV